MSALAAFTDLLVATKAASLSDPDKLVSQATQYRTTLFRRMMKGLSQKAMVQNGTKIVDHVQLKTVNRRRHYNPTDTFGYTGSNSLTQIEVPWRFSLVDMVTQEHELDLNQGDRVNVFKRVLAAKNAEMEQSFWEGNEDDLWAAPNFDTMESSTLGEGVTGAPLSLRCFITADGAVPSASNGGIASGSSAWTSIMGVSPTTYPNWKNQYETFDNTSATTRSADVGGVLDAMHRMWLDVQWESPDTTQKYFEDTRLNKMVIVCNKESMVELKRLATMMNNVLTPRHDIGWAAGGVVFNGLPITYLAKLDSIDTGGTAGNGTYASGALTYQWRWINFNHIKPIFHSGHYRKRQEKDGGAAQPFSKVVIEDTWQNLWCANRREQGIVRAA